MNASPVEFSGVGDNRAVFRGVLRRTAAFLITVPLIVAPLAGALARSGGPTPDQPVARDIPPAVSLPGNPALESGQAQIRTVHPPERALLRGGDPDSTGILDSADGGFGIHLWQGTPRTMVIGLLAALPLEAPSPAMRDLARRLLLTTAQAPAGAGEVGAGGTLTALRLEKLAALGGGAADVAALAATLPPLSGPVAEAVLQAVTDAQLLESDSGPDCPTILERSRPFSGASWEKIRLLCRQRLGDDAGVALGRDMLREQGDADDAFAQLLERMASPAAASRKPLSLALPQPLPAVHVALLRLTGQPVPGPVLAATRIPARVAALARMGTADPLARLALVEWGARQGVLGADAVVDAYEGSPLPRLSPAEVEKRTDASPETRALVHRALRASPDPGQQDRLCLRALRLTPAAGRATPLGQVGLRCLQDRGAVPALSGLAVAAARALLAQNRLDAARPWLALAMRTPEHQAEAVGLWPLYALAGTEEAFAGPVAFEAWRAQAMAQDPVVAAGILALLEATGVAVPPAAWSGLVPPVRDGDPTRLAALRDAVAGNRVGAVIAGALIALGNGGPAEASLGLMAAVAASLRAVEREDEARALAREALAARL